MKNRLSGMVLGSFLGDALSLPAHWIYNTEKILSTFGRIDNLVDIASHSYHKTKKKGDFSHYGDQVMMLLDYLKREEVYQSEGYKKYWLEQMGNYTGYIDHATKETISIISQTMSLEGSASSDLAGASMIAPLVYNNHIDTDRLIQEVEAFISLTHHNERVLDIGKFIACVLVDVINGMKPLHAVSFQLEHNQYLSTEGKAFIVTSMENAEKYLAIDSTKAITTLGQSCGVLQAFPSTMYLLLKHEEDLENALIDNVMAGGDSAARGLMIGMILGANCGKEKLPLQWLSKMNHYSEILRLLS